MGRLYDIIQRHIDAQPYGASQAQIAQAVGVSRTTIGNWREPRKLIGKKTMERLAAVTGTTYAEVLEANLYDIGYATEDPAERREADAG